MVNRNYEWEMLTRKMNSVQERTEKVVQKLFGKSRRLRPTDKLSLTILLTWEERYGVSVEEILEYLLPLFQKMAKGKRRTSLPVRVTTLVSKQTEKLLQEYLTQTYPEGSLERMTKLSRQENELQKIIRDDSDPKPKNVLDFESLEEYRDYYQNRVLKIRRQNDRIIREKQERTLPYRGNPWK